MNLKGCIIDGIWPKDNIYTFTIRSVTDDSNFLYLVTQHADIKLNITMMKRERLVSQKPRTGSGSSKRLLNILNTAKLSL